MSSTLTTKRVLSIDALRGITILTMIFVNDVAGVTGIPGWMEHAAADADAMTFVDVVFPAFLFIVGMSIPFALNARKEKGDSWLALQGHILIRTLGLLTVGVFMVNAEGGYNEAAMGMSIHVWSLLFYTCVILVWNVYRFKKQALAWVLRSVGIVGLIVLATQYRGGEDGTQYMSPQWWGILGLIGWAYLFGSCIYQLGRNSIIALLGVIAGCILWYIAGNLKTTEPTPLLEWIGERSGHAIHTSIVLCGVVLSLIFFDKPASRTNTQRFMQAIIFMVVTALIAYLLRPRYHISKIYATPSWALFSVAICTGLFCALYWIIDIKKQSGWTAFFKPAATNPLLVYILPVIVYHIQAYFSLYFMPEAMHVGWTGVAWSLVYALIIMWSVTLLNKIKIRLQL